MSKRKQNVIRGVAAATLVTAFAAASLLWAQGLPQPLPPPTKPPAAILAPDRPTPEQGSQVEPVEAPIFRTSTINVLVPVTVFEKSSGKFVNGLTPLDFELYDNNKRQAITEDIAAHPISLVVAIQANSGMEQVLPNIKKIGSLLNQLVVGESGEVAIIAFDHKLQHLTDFTTDPDQISEALKKLKPGSSASRLDDAAMDAVNMLRRRPDSRKRILLLISEARDYSSEIKPREVLTAMEFANVVTYSVDVSHLITSLTSKAQPPRPNPIPPEARHMADGSIATLTTDSQMNVGNWTPVLKEIFTQVKGVFVKNSLEVYTQYTGGREHSFMTQKALEQAVADIGEELHSQYLLTYSPNNLTEGGFHEIKVVVRKPGLDVRKRDGYWLAGKPQ